MELRNIIGHRLFCEVDEKRANWKQKKYSRTLLQLYEISLFLIAGDLGSADRKACCEGIVFIFVCVVTLIIYVDAVFVWMRRCCPIMIFTSGEEVRVRSWLLRLAYDCPDVSRQSYHDDCKRVNPSVGSEHMSPASPPDERPWCGECDNFIHSNQEISYCGLLSCRWVLHHNCVRPHYLRRHPFHPIPDGFEMQ